ncbi:MAG: HD domain-containing phosphohydrolase [Dehalococcoidia bacterium]
MGSLAVATSMGAGRELRVRPARRIDLLAHFSGAFDLAEDQRPGHAARVAYLGSRVAEALHLGTEEQARVLHVGLLHDSGLGLRAEGMEADAAAWVARRFGLEAQIEEAVRATSERWDGRGRPLGLSGTEIPVEALCVSAAHWACEFADHVDHPLRARASLQRAHESELIPIVGAEVAEVLRDVLREDETWLAVFGDDIAGLVARLGVGEGKPSRRRVEEATEAMGAVIDAAVREPGRAFAVAAVSRALGAQLGLSEGACEMLAVAGHLLDIGQLGVPRTILGKPSILTVDEMELMRRHPGVGGRLVAGVPGFEDVADWLEQHHERPDGRGYPEMLADDELPLPPRILAVADTYWALRAHRPYRAAYEAQHALETLHAGAGKQFDAEIVEALPAALEVADLVLAQRELGLAEGLAGDATEGSVAGGREPLDLADARR